MKRHIFIIAGEASGDLYGSHLARQLKAIGDDITLSGLGGEKMRREGVHLYYDLTSIAVVGLFEVLREFRTFKNIFDTMKRRLDEVRPDAVVLIDYPGFNLRFAKEVKRRRIKLIYYISPQVWAWGRRRLQVMRRLVDKMLVLFAFEEKLYRDNGINVEFTGHPLVDIARPSMGRDDALASFGLLPDKTTIALLAGSRAIEVKRMLPAMLEASMIIKRTLPEAQFVVSKSPTLDKDIYEKISKEEAADIAIAEDNIYDCLNASDAAIVCSGTATIDSAIMGKPMAVVYKLSNLTYFFLRALVSTPNIAMANIIARKTVVPELVQFEMTPKNIAREMLGILKDAERREGIIKALKGVKDALGPPGASRRAAEAVLKELP